MVAPAAHDEPASASAGQQTNPGSPVPVTSPRMTVTRDPIAFAASNFAIPSGSLYPPASGRGVDFMAGETEWKDSYGQGNSVLEFADGLALSGHSFGAEKSISGECVFQTG